MQNASTIELHKVRGVAEVITVAMVFLREHLPTLARCIARIVLPAGLVSAICLGGMIWGITDVAAEASLGAEDDVAATAFGMFYLGFLLSFLVVGTLQILVVIGYVRVYQKQGGGPVAPAEVWALTRRGFWRILWTTVGLSVIVLIMSFVLAIPIGILTSIGVATGSFMVTGILILLAYLALLGVLLVFWAGASMIYPIRIFEGGSFSSALPRAFRLVRGRWWDTIGVWMIGLVCLYALGGLLLAPQIGLMFVTENTLIGLGGGLYQLLTIVLSLLGWAYYLFLYAIPLLVLTFQYFSLVEEKERPGLMKKVETAFPQTLPAASAVAPPEPADPPAAVVPPEDPAIPPPPAPPAPPEAPADPSPPTPDQG